MLLTHCHSRPTCMILIYSSFSYVIPLEYEHELYFKIFLPWNILMAVFQWFVFVGSMFTKRVVVLTTSIHRNLDSWASSAIVQDFLIIVRCATSFCWGLWNFVRFFVMFLTYRRVSNSLDIYSIPLLDLKVLIFLFVCFSIITFKIQNFEYVSFFVFMKYKNVILE